MFDLSNLDFVQVDHLLMDTRYRVLQPFTDASGNRHVEGEEFLYRSANLNMTAKRLTLRVENAQCEKSEWLIVYEERGDGPRPGNLKAYFEDAGYVGVDPEVRKQEREAVIAAHPAGEPKGSQDAMGETRLNEVFALALRGEFDAAEALLKQVDEAQALGEHHVEKLGGWLMNSAFNARELKTARWFARKAMNQWQFWAACSSSGGEGAARSRYVERIRKELAGYL
ncbi:MAG: hypothetical protein ABI972_15470 [Acidobacteriota bacterium]